MDNNTGIDLRQAAMRRADWHAHIVNIESKYRPQSGMASRLTLLNDQPVNAEKPRELLDDTITPAGHLEWGILAMPP